MSDLRVPRFTGTYPEPTGATLDCSAHFGPVEVSSASVLKLPSFYLRPGQSLLLELGLDGRITIKEFGE